VPEHLNVQAIPSADGLARHAVSTIYGCQMLKPGAQRLDHVPCGTAKVRQAQSVVLPLRLMVRSVQTNCCRFSSAQACRFKVISYDLVSGPG
jgi:hypothetical protein